MRYRAPFVVTALVLALATHPGITCPRLYTDEELSDDLDEVGEQLELLWNGTTAERLAIAENPWPRFAPWEQPIADADRPQLAQQMETLDVWVRHEPETEIVAAVLQHLAAIDLPALTPVFRRALAHPSPDVRWAAVGRFALFRDPLAGDALAELWRIEDRARIRIDTALALACQGSGKHADTWRTWLRDSRPAVVEAAVRALAQVRDERALPGVLRLARGAEPPLRAVALEALPAWPASDDVLDSLLTALDEDGRVFHAAARLLIDYPDERAQARLVELAASDPERAWKVVTFASPVDPARRDLLRRIESEIGAESRQLWVEMFGDLPSRLEYPLVDATQDDDGADPPERCGLRPLHRDPRFDRPLEIAAAGRAQTIRCASSPRTGGANALLFRVASGAAVQYVWDVAELGSGTWVLADFAEPAGCWVEATSLVDAGTQASPVDEDAIPLEFDLPVEEVASRPFEALRTADLVETFDPSSDMVGVRLLADLEDPRAIALLAAAVDDGGTFLELHILAALGTVPPELWPDADRARLGELLAASGPSLGLYELIRGRDSR